MQQVGWGAWIFRWKDIPFLNEFEKTTTCEGTLRKEMTGNSQLRDTSTSGEAERCERYHLSGVDMCSRQSASDGPRITSCGMALTG